MTAPTSNQNYAESLPASEDQRVHELMGELDAALLKLHKIAAHLRGASALLELHAARAPQPISDVDVLIDSALAIVDEI